MKRVLIIGGYGNFGRFIARRLAQQNNLSLIIAGRSLEKAQSLAQEINSQACQLDINENLIDVMAAIQPDIVIHTSGPFQSQGYHVAQACIAQGAHYIDIADGREFVAGIETLNDAAKEAGVLVISGASSVPCLTSALIDHYKNDFATVEHVDYGITTAQKTTRGLATTAAILSYTGQPFETLVNGKKQRIFGWQGLKARKYPQLGWRLLGNCNVPDLEIFPQRYPGLKTVRFYAGLELPFIHITLWSLSWLVRMGLVKRLERTAPRLLRLSFLFDRLGTASSGFHLTLTGKGNNREDKSVTFELVAHSGDGPYIPCMPAILLCQKLANSEVPGSGAQPCVGLISKDEYLNALQSLDIHWSES